MTERLAAGRSRPRSPTSTIGLDPDLYPLLASSQTRTGGSNVAGVQDPALDKLLVAARAAGHARRPRRRPTRRSRSASRTGRYLLPLAFADEAVVVRDTVTDRPSAQVADPADRFWDVLTWRLADGR